MKTVVKLLLSLLLAGVASFCVFGFLCTYEPLPPRVQMTWRVIYAVVGLAGLGALVPVWRIGRTG